MHINSSSVIASHMLRYMQTIRSIYNTINHTVTVTGQRSIEVFTRVYGSDKFHKVSDYLHMYISVSSVIASHTFTYTQKLFTIYTTRLITQ